MIRMIDPITPEAEATIRAAVTEVMADFAVLDCQIEAKFDYDDDEAIFVEVYHDKVDQPYDPALEIRLLSLVCDRLHALGEYRFPYVDHHFPEGQKIKGW